MISVIGLGNAGSAVAEKFSGLSQYNVYTINNKVKRTSKYNFRLKKHDTPEECEKNEKEKIS